VKGTIESSARALKTENVKVSVGDHADNGNSLFGDSGRISGNLRMSQHLYVHASASVCIGRAAVRDPLFLTF